MKRLFTERYGGGKPRVSEVLDGATANGLLRLVAARITEHWFGDAFPFPCQDGQLNAGCDVGKLRGMMATFEIVWPEEWIGAGQLPTDGQIFNLIEFSYEHIAEPHSYAEHAWHSHYHYRYDQGGGRIKFEADVNRIFEHNGIALELTQGEVTRMAPTGFQEALAQTVFRTGDGPLDQLLEDARHKFLNRDLKVRKESLEKLWDAWERLKTIGPGKNKAEQAQSLLSKLSLDPAFHLRVEKEAKELTDIGNSFMIRHTETNKIPITESPNVDYLFHRMFALIRLLLRTNDLGG